MIVGWGGGAEAGRRLLPGGEDLRPRVQKV